MHRYADTHYSPLYFLASVGAGGLVVTFFMMLMFWVPHPAQPVPVFEDIARAATLGGLPMQITIAAAALGIAIFGVINLRLLAWNLGAFGRFRATDSYTTLTSSNAGSQVLAQPLALAMSVNVLFILGLVFVPGLWSIVEVLFPLALLAFVAIGALALVQLGRFVTRALASGGFSCAANNSFAQMLPAFALAMVAVGLSAPAAMSGNMATVGVSLVLSTAFLTGAFLIVAIVMVLGLRAMLENGVSAETAPTLMVIIPFLTVAGIAMLRQNHGLHTTFDSHTAAADTLMFLTKLLAVQLLFAGLGIAVLRAVGYGRFLAGEAASAGSWALVCPGVALNVMLHFWINKGLVATGLIAKFGALWWTFSAVAIAAQVAMIALVILLHAKHFAKTPLAA